MSPPSVQQMILRLEAGGFIERVPWQSRSIRVLAAREELPDLQVGTFRQRAATTRGGRLPLAGTMRWPSARNLSAWRPAPPGNFGFSDPSSFTTRQ